MAGELKPENAEEQNVGEGLTSRELACQEDDENRMQTSLAEVLGQQGLGELIKPMVKEIELFDSYVAGTTHLEDETVLGEIKPGDRLALQREENAHDSKAIVIQTAEKKKLGYVPEKDNVVFARLMDAGKVLTAKITEVAQKGAYTQVKIKIYLLDF